MNPFAQAMSPEIQQVECENCKRRITTHRVWAYVGTSKLDGCQVVITITSCGRCGKWSEWMNLKGFGIVILELTINEVCQIKAGLTTWLGT